MNFSFGPGRKDVSSRNDVRVEYAPGKRVFPWIRWYLILFLVFSPLFFFLYRMMLPWFVVDSPAVLSMITTPVTMPRTGKILAVPLPVGSWVRKGDALFWIEEDAVEAKRDRLELLYARLFAMAPPAVSPSSRQSIALARRVLQQAELDRKNVEELLRNRAATDADLRLARQTEIRAKADLIREQEGQKALLLQERRQQELLQAERLQIEAEIELLESQVDSQDIVSPVEGEVLNFDVGVGMTVAQGTPLAVVADPSSACIVVFADAEAFPFIKREATAEVQFPGRMTLRARVDQLPLMAQNIPTEFATFSGARRTIRVRLTPLSPIPSEYRIEGLPLIVRWGVRLPDLLKKFTDGKEGD